jgi:hypothetical protein
MAKTAEIKVNLENSDVVAKLSGLVKEIAAVSEIELTDEQLSLVDIDWNAQVKEEGKIQIDGNDYITLNELRRLARLRGYISSKPTVIQTPEYENKRQATVEWEIIWRDGIIDGSAADAAWHTCNPGFRNFTVAIASNRAEARCIRAALGIDTCSFEEIGPEDEDLSGPSSDQQKSVITMLLSRYKIDVNQFAELFGDDIASKIIDGDTVNVSSLSHQDAVKMVAVLNKYKK